MQRIKKLFDFYIFSNIHVAIGVYCFSCITLNSFELHDKLPAVFSFFATILSYNFIRLLLVPKERNWMAVWFVNHKKSLTILSIFCAVFCAVYSFKLRFESVLILIPFTLVTFFYGMSLPLKSISLRRIPGIKILLIAFCFSGVTVLFPLVENYVEVSSGTWWYFLQRFFFATRSLTKAQ